jgi:hypothetical protein
MTSICWKSAVTWSLLGLMFLLFVLMWGPAPALAGEYDHLTWSSTRLPRTCFWSPVMARPRAT